MRIQTHAESISLGPELSPDCGLKAVNVHVDSGATNTEVKIGMFTCMKCSGNSLFGVGRTTLNASTSISSLVTAKQEAAEIITESFCGNLPCGTQDT